MTEIFEFIKSIVMNDIFIQALGFIGLIIQVFSMQCKAYDKVIYLTITAEFVFAVQLLMLGAYTGAATNFAACVCNFIYYLLNKKGKSTLPFQILFGAMFVAIGILTWQGALSVLVIIAKLVSTVSYGMKNTKFIRVGRLISMPLWLVYDIMSFSIGGALNDVLVITSTIIGIIRLDRKKKNESVSETNTAE